MLSILFSGVSAIAWFLTALVSLRVSRSTIENPSGLNLLAAGIAGVAIVFALLAVLANVLHW